jgi:hypothetical protein
MIFPFNDKQSVGRGNILRHRALKYFRRKFFSCSINLVLLSHILQNKRNGQVESLDCLPTAYRYSLPSILVTATTANKSKSNMDGLISGTPR